MKRLSGLDAGFLWMETPSTAMHVAGLCVFDPPEDSKTTFGIDDVKDMVRSRLHMAPPFRQRLVSVPFQLHFPIWIEDPNFDLDHHIKHIAVPAPGGTREVTELVSQLNAVQLDRNRPLWEMWFIEGLEKGRFATLTKVHHAAIDGASGSEITLALLDLTPEVTEHPEPGPWKPEAIPTDVEMLAYAGQSLIRQPVQLVGAVRRTVRAAVDMRSLAKDTPETPGSPLPFSAPRTSINGSISGNRSVAFSRLSLSDVKKVKNAFGCTVNDVVLALCSSTLRHYFEQRGEQIDGPLVAMVPVSVRTEDQREAMGNQVSSMFANLATDEPDPVARLLTIHEGMRGAKEQNKAVGADTLTNWAEFAAPAVFGSAMRLYTRLSLADRHRPVFNVTISNVPGPPFPLYSAGAKMVANFPVGPIMDGGALNITVMSYRDSLDVGISTCPDVVDDVWILSDGLQDALDDLLAATDALDNGVSTGRRTDSKSTVDGAPPTAVGAASTALSAAGTTTVHEPPTSAPGRRRSSLRRESGRPARTATRPVKATSAKKSAGAAKKAATKKAVPKASAAKASAAAKAPRKTSAAKTSATTKTSTARKKAAAKKTSGAKKSATSKRTTAPRKLSTARNATTARKATTAGAATTARRTGPQKTADRPSTARRVGSPGSSRSTVATKRAPAKRSGANARRTATRSSS